MTILADHEIAKLVDKGLLKITPFYNQPVRELEEGEKVISYGLSSYGYDIRVDNKFFVFNNAEPQLIVDPKSSHEWERGYKQITGTKSKPVLIPPHGFALASSFEFVKMPKDVMALCVGKSTYARCGIIVNVTPIEPGWEGYITIEISNTTPLPCAIYPREGIAQLVFFKGRPCTTSYSDKKGKYQSQVGITLPRL